MQTLTFVLNSFRNQTLFLSSETGMFGLFQNDICNMGHCILYGLYSLKIVLNKGFFFSFQPLTSLQLYFKPPQTERLKVRFLEDEWFHILKSRINMSNTVQYDKCNRCERTAQTLAVLRSWLRVDWGNQVSQMILIREGRQSGLVEGKTRTGLWH